MTKNEQMLIDLQAEKIARLEEELKKTQERYDIMFTMNLEKNEEISNLKEEIERLKGE